MYLALSYPRQISAIIGAYPMLDVEAPFYNTLFEKRIVGVPTIAPELLASHLQSMDRRESHAPTSAMPPDRLALSFAITQSGRYLEFLGSDDSRLFPLRRLANPTDADGEGGGANLPYMFIYHGREDSAVPADGTVLFESTLSAHRPKARLFMSLQPGDHGFDALMDIQTPWLRQGLDQVCIVWLA